MAIEMQYEPEISLLEGKVSYGTLGIINSLVKMTKGPAKWDVFLINAATLVRNNVEKDRTDVQIIQAVLTDIQTLLSYVEAYMQSSQGIAIIYFNSPRLSIPSEYRRTATANRRKVESITTTIAKEHGYATNQLNDLNYAGANLKVFSYQHTSKLPYRFLLDILRYETKYNRALMLSHSSVDYLLLRMIDRVDIMSSHTGAILGIADLGKKIFKDDDIPFYITTLRLFGDKDTLVPIIRNKPKALRRLVNRKLRRMSEREIVRLATTVLGVTQKQLQYKF